MCGGLEFQKRSGEPVRVLFPNPKAALLVDYSMNLWLPWGRRREEPGDWPEGGWFRSESIHKGYWKRWGSERIPIWPARWMEKDHQRKSHWFEMPPGHAMVCLKPTKAPASLYTTRRHVAATTLAGAIPWLLRLLLGGSYFAPGVPSLAAVTIQSPLPHRLRC